MNINLGHINKIASVSVILKDDSYVFNVVVLKFKNKLLQIVKQVDYIHTVEELLKVTGKYNSFILHFSGKGILNKKVENSINYRSKIFMNANLEDFYFTDLVSKEFVFTSVIRKSVVQEIVDLFNIKLNHIIGVSSGPFVLDVLKTQLNDDSLITSGNELIYEKDELKSFRKLKEPIVKNYKLDNKSVNQNEIPAVAHASLFFNSNENFVLPQDDLFSKIETEQKNIFIRFGTFTLGFFILILLGNMVYLEQLNKTITSNYTEISLSEETLNQVGKLTEEKSRKEKMLSSSGLMNKQFLTYFLKEISNSLPNEIVFNRISLRPYVNEIKKNFKIEIKENMIYVLGETQTSNILSEWIIKIKQKEWIGKIDILNYAYSKGRGEFELKIEIINV